VSFPWWIRDVTIARVQVIMAIIGMHNLKRCSSRKMRFARSFPNIRKTRHYLTSPYLILADVERSEIVRIGRRIKPSYAVHHEPENSLRPDLIVIHNKGFFDY
jgi:hypothetical protein